MPCRRTAARTARSGPAGSPGRSARTRDLRCRRAGTWRGRPRSVRARSRCRWSERRGRAYGGGRGDSPPEAATTRAARVSRVDSSKRRYVTPMSRQDRLSADLDRGFRALEEGDVDEAQKVLERTERIDRHNADVVTLAAAIADAQADFATALLKYKELAELRPDDPMPRVCIARILLQDEGDAEASLEAIEAAFEFIDEEEDLIEAVIVRTEALLALDDVETARASLSELATSVIDNPEIALDLGELALAAEDLDAAKRWIEIVRKEPALEADAQHLLGRICEAAGDRKGMIAAWQRVRELDANLPAPPVTISEDELERIAAEALAELPEDVRAKLELVLGDRDGRRRQVGIELAHALPRRDHALAIAGGLADPAEQVLGVGLERRLLADDLAHTLGGVEIFRSQRELAVLEGDFRDVDHAGRELAERLARRLDIIEREQRRGAHDHGLDQVLFLVDELECRLDRLERCLRISLILQQDSRDAHARHRIVGAQLRELLVLEERRREVGLGVGDGGGERHDVRVVPIDPLGPLEHLLRFVDITLFECTKTAIEIRAEAILARHGRYIAPFATVIT